MLRHHARIQARIAVALLAATAALASCSRPSRDGGLLPPPGHGGGAFALGSVQTLQPSTTPAPSLLFYQYNETGAVAREMDATASGTLATQTLTYAPNESNANFGWVSASNVPGITAWPAQTYTVNLRVSAPNTALAITEVKVYRVDSSGGPTTTGLATVADLPALNVSLGSAQTLTFTLDGSAQPANATDRIGVKFYVRNSTALMQSFGYEAGAGTASHLSAGAAATPTPTPTATPIPTATPTPTAAPTAAHDPYTASVLANAPVQNYEFEDPAGTVALDSSASHVNGTYVGRVQFGLSGPIRTESLSGAIGLSGGTASAGALLPNPNASAGSYTVEAWVYPLLGSSYMTVWGYSGTHRLLVSGSGLLLSQFAGSFFSHAALATSSWHYVVFDYDAVAQRASYFVDGALDTSAPLSTAAASFTSAYYAGEYDTSTWYKWNGRLAQFAFYKSALTGPQVNAHYRAAGYATPTPQRDAPCSGYRWTIKTASDANAGAIDFDDTIPTTILGVTRTPVSGASVSTPRVVPFETSVYELTNVTLKQIFHAVDNDYHLVLGDSQGHTMIAESTDPSCAPESRFLPQLKAVRSAIDIAVPHVSATPLAPNVPVTVQGVGYFDYLPNGAVGQAPDGVELHPITAICFGVDCRPAP